MVEKKVSEILAARTQSAPPPQEISEDVKRRLEALERRIDDERRDDTRSDGLRFLLMARQHKERGENTSALKMYEMALPYFLAKLSLSAKSRNSRLVLLETSGTNLSTSWSLGRIIWDHRRRRKSRRLADHLK